MCAARLELPLGARGDRRRIAHRIDGLLRVSDEQEELTGRVLRIAGGVYDVDTGDEILRASIRGRVKRTDARIVSVGDRVRLERLEDESRITAMLCTTDLVLRRRGLDRRLSNGHRFRSDP